MGFLVGCYCGSPRGEAVDRAIEAMASFFVELGFRKTRFELGPHCSLGWIWKREEEAAPPIVETETGYFFGDVALYNRRQLSAKLNCPEVASSNITDLGLVAKLVDAFGTTAIREVNGDFILGRLDRRTGHLRLFRDHFGVRALYYLTKPGITYFASAVPALLRLAEAPVEPSLHSLGVFLLLGHPILDRTFFNEIRVLPPSRCMEIDGRSAPVLTQYWTPAPSRFSVGLSRQDIVPAFRELLIEAIEARLSTSGATAILLSGGLDSSTIAAIACSRNPDRKIISVTTTLPEGYRGSNTDEKAYVDEMARCFPNLVPCFDDGLSADPLGSPDDPMILGHPVGAAFEYMSDSMCQQASARGAEVLLTGWGGDDCVSGHPWSFLIESLLRLRLDLAWFEVMRMRQGGASISLIASQYVVKPLLPLQVLRWRRKIVGADWIQKKALSTTAFQDLGLIGHLQEYGLDSLLQRGRTVARDEAKNLGNHLKKGGMLTDEVEIRRGIRARAPLLDVPLVEAALSVPFDLKNNASQHRLLIREAARPFLPDRIRARKDKGHANPDFRRRIGECEMRLRQAFEIFHSNAIWSYLVDGKKVEHALSELRHGADSGETDVLIQHSVCLPYQLGRFLMAIEGNSITKN